MKTTLRVALSLILAASMTCLAFPAATGAEDTAVTDADREEARTIYTQRCGSCHGEQGKGDGPVSAALNPAPRDLSLPEWQDSVTDEYLRTIILKGGPAVEKSVLMPPNPDLEAKPAVVAAMAELVRGLRAD